VQNAHWMGIDYGRIEHCRVPTVGVGGPQKCPALNDGAIGAFVGAAGGPPTCTDYTHMLTSRCGLLTIIMRVCLSKVRQISESDEAEMTAYVRTPPREIHPCLVTKVVRRSVTYEIQHGLILFFWATTAAAVE